jgi:hypothetical protein
MPKAPIVNGSYRFVNGTFFFQSIKNTAPVNISPLAAHEL